MYIKTREVHNGDTDTGEDDVLFHITMDNTLCVTMFIVCLYSHLPVPCHMFFKQYIHNSSRNMSHSAHITYTIMCTFKTIHLSSNTKEHNPRGHTFDCQKKLVLD